MAHLARITGPSQVTHSYPLDRDRHVEFIISSEKDEHNYYKIDIFYYPMNNKNAFASCPTFTKNPDLDPKLTLKIAGILSQFQNPFECLAAVPIDINLSLFDRRTSFEQFTSSLEKAEIRLLITKNLQPKATF